MTSKVLPAPLDYAVTLPTMRTIPLGGSGTFAASFGAGSAASFGSWSQVIAATPADCLATALTIGINNAAVAANDWQRCELGVGAAAAEQPSASFLFLAEIAGGSGYYGTFGTCRLAFPLLIPGGSRIALRGMGSVAASVYYVLHLVDVADLR